jgi:glycosyltransferase involved in cell wall biosynthesis
VKIFFLVGRLGVGGAERQIVHLSRGLASRGHQVGVWTLFPGGELRDDVAADPGIEGGSLCRDRYSSRVGGALDLAVAAPRLRGVLRAHRPDIIYSMLYPASAVAGLSIGRRPLVPWAFGIRTAVPELNWKRLPFFKLCAWLSGRAALIVANSHRGLEAHRQRGFNTARGRVIHNGIDIDTFRPSAELRRRTRRELGIPQDAVVVGRAARLTPVKDHPTFLEAAAIVHRRRPECLFLCVGGGPEHYLGELDRLSHALGIDDRVIWAGERHDMPAIYNAMDVAVSNSRNEGFPNVVAEAMACGVPNVVSDVGDSALLVGDSGRVVPAGDERLLAQAIEALVRVTHEPAGSRCRRRIRDRFSVQEAVVKTEVALREVLGE